MLPENLKIGDVLEVVHKVVVESHGVNRVDTVVARVALIRKYGSKDVVVSLEESGGDINFFDDKYSFSNLGDYPILGIRRL